LPLVGLPLAKWFLIPGITVADGLLAVPMAVRLSGARPRQLLGDVPVTFRLFGLFWSWALAAGVWAAYASPLPFSSLEFVKSLVKLTFYLVAAGLLASQWTAEGPQRARALLGSVLAVHSVLTIALYVGSWIQPDLIAALPLPGHDRPWQGIYYPRRWFADNSLTEILAFPRARGLLQEPSTLGIVHTLGLGFLLLAPRRPPRLGAAHLLILVSILLTFSLTSYALLLATVPLVLCRWRWELARLVQPRRLLSAAAILLGVCLIPAVHATLDTAVTERVGHLVGGFMDSSARARLVENWRTAGRMVDGSLLTGVGLGNYDVALEQVRQDMPLPELVPPGTQGWNVLAYCLATTGVVGLALLLIPLAALARAHPALGILLFASLFTHAGFLETIFWIPFALFVSAAEVAGRQPAEGAPSGQVPPLVERSPARLPTRW
jgi:hypothetical protein